MATRRGFKASPSTVQPKLPPFHARMARPCFFISKSVPLSLRLQTSGGSVSASSGRVGWGSPPGTPMQPQVPQSPSPALPREPASRACSWPSTQSQDGLFMEGQAGLRVDGGGQRLASLQLRRCPVLLLSRSFPPSFCKERAPGVSPLSLPSLQKRTSLHILQVLTPGLATPLYLQE